MPDQIPGITTYPLTDEEKARLDRTFTYHAPKGDQAARYTVLRDAAREFAETILVFTPPSRERSIAITHLEECVMQANAAIARNE